MSHPRTLSRWIALLATCLALAGCGGGGDATTSTTMAAVTVDTATTDTADTSTQATDPVDKGANAGSEAPDCTDARPTEMEWDEAPEMTIDPDGSYTATLHTAQGEVVIELLPKEAPVAVNNFVFLADNCFYTEVPIHRVVQGFVIQSGDPTGTGTGGPGYTIEDEDVSMDYERGTVAMARTLEPNSAGSQFFIALTDLTSAFPNREYVIFGRVTKGMEVVDEIANVEVGPSPGGEVSQPVEPIVIEQVTVTEV